MKTDLLYLLQCYLQEFDAKVTGVLAERKAVILDKTCFYYTGGGQPNDTGRLVADGSEYKVVNVEKDRETGEILHFLDSTPTFPSSTPVHGTVDWERRYRHMRYHTCLHVLSNIAYREFGAIISGNQIYEDHGRVDFSLENFTPEIIDTIISKGNEIARASLPVKWYFLPLEQAKQKFTDKTRLAFLPQGVENVRIVEIVGFDFDACGGTHLKNTSEIGEIRFLRKENKGKNNRRIEVELG